MAKQGKKQTRRLNARIKDWGNIKGTHSEKECTVNKSSFRKPGSNRK